MSCDGCPSNQTVMSVKKGDADAAGAQAQQKGSLSMTKEAAKYIDELLLKEKKAGWGLKIEVVEGGCAGYRYYMAFQEKPEDNEKAYEFHGVKLFLSPESIEMLGPSVIEYIATLEASGLRVNNPNATRTCGCGKSFG